MATSRTATLTPRDNFHRMMGHRDPAWLPLDLPMTPPVMDEMERRMGTRDARLAFDLDFDGVGARIASTSAQWKAALDALGCDLPANADYSSAGFVHVRPPAGDVGAAYHFSTMLHPLERITRVEQLPDLPWPDVAAPEAYAHLPQAVADIHAAGRVACAGMECTVFEQAWYARGMDNLYLDLIEGNGISDWLLDWHTRRSVQLASRYAAAGVDVIGLGDDIGTQRGMMMSPDFWRTYLKPRLKHVIDAIRAHQRQHIWIKYHSDGDIRDVLGDLVELGIDILNPVQPECMPAPEVIPAHQHHLAFWGLVGTQTTMPFGSPDDVRHVVHQCAQHARAGAAIVIAPTHVLEPDVPWSNIAALVEAVKQLRLN